MSKASVHLDIGAGLVFGLTIVIQTPAIDAAIQFEGAAVNITSTDNPTRDRLIGLRCRGGKGHQQQYDCCHELYSVDKEFGSHVFSPINKLIVFLFADLFSQIRWWMAL